MEIRALQQGDMDALSSFILDSYDNYPSSMWFNSKPQKENVERIFYNKINGLASRLLADFVAVQSGIIVGECEIVRVHGELGVVGMVVRKELSRKKVGTKLLDRTIQAAKEIGIFKINAEVSEKNEPALRFFIVNGFTPISSRQIEKQAEKLNIVILERKIR